MNNESQNSALTSLLVSYIAAKDQLVQAALESHPSPGNVKEDLASGNLVSEILVSDNSLRIVLLIAATGVPIQENLLHFSLPVMQIKGGIQ